MATSGVVAVGVNSEMRLCGGAVACIALGFTGVGVSGIGASRGGFGGSAGGNWMFSISSSLSFSV